MSDCTILHIIQMYILKIALQFYHIGLSGHIHLPQSSRSYSSGKQYMWFGIPLGKVVSFWALILCVFQTVLLKMSSSLWTSGIMTNAKSILKYINKKQTCLFSDFTNYHTKIFSVSYTDSRAQWKVGVGCVVLSIIFLILFTLFQYYFKNEPFNCSFSCDW